MDDNRGQSNGQISDVDGLHADVDVDSPFVEDAPIVEVTTLNPEVISQLPRTSIDVRRSSRVPSDVSATSRASVSMGISVARPVSLSPAAAAGLARFLSEGNNNQTLGNSNTARVMNDPSNGQGASRASISGLSSSHSRASVAQSLHRGSSVAAISDNSPATTTMSTNFDPSQAPLEAIPLHDGEGDDVDEENDPATAAARKRPGLLKQVSSFAAWEVGKEKYGVCLGPSKEAKFCWLIVLICMIMFIVELYEGNWTIVSLELNPTVGPDVTALVKLGAKRADLIVDSKEYYRLFAPMFLHGGVVHLVLNMIGLRNIGMPLEREYGSLKIMYIYLTSGFMGILVSCIFLPYSVGVGASGAIFGLFGAAWADLIQNWSLYKKQGIGIRVLIQLILATILNLGIGLLPYLDNFAHFGGFLNGIFTGLTVLIQDRFNRFGELKNRKCYQSCLQVFSVLVTPISMIVALLVLFLKVDAVSCQWCGYLDCVPSDWWSCDPCSNSDIKASVFANNNTVVLTCPNTNTVIYYPFNSTVVVGAQSAIEACRASCEG